VNGQTFNRTFQDLKEFGTSSDAQLNTFAGTVTYKTTINLDQGAKWLQLGKVNKGVTEIFLNGDKVGTNWYGKPVFHIGSAVKKGENLLEIKYTTVLSNYLMSLENNPTAARWTKGYEKTGIGLEGEVSIYD
jgi:hypothetical protein